MRVDITNRTSSLRRFTAGGRYLTLAGGESERGIEISKEEADALDATNEFRIKKLDDDSKADAKPAPKAPEPQPAQTKPAT